MQQNCGERLGAFFVARVRIIFSLLLVLSFIVCTRVAEGGIFHIQCHKKLYLSASNGGGGSVSCDRKKPDKWEQFRVVCLSSPLLFSSSSLLFSFLFFSSLLLSSLSLLFSFLLFSSLLFSSLSQIIHR